jgi:hypothetical protein
MSNQSVPCDLNPNAATAVVTAKPRQWRSRVAFIRDALDGTRRIRSTIGMVGLAVIVTGIALSVGGTIWAVQLGVPYPIVIMAGYCTLVGSACLATALLIFMPFSQRATPIDVRPSSNFAAWKLVRRFSVSDASRLWCDIEPGSPLTQDSSAWARALLDAISRGELPMIEKAGATREAIDHERNNPNWHTEVTQDALRSWARSHGHNPRFLRD